LPLLPVLLPALILALAEPLPVSATAHLSLLEMFTDMSRLSGVDLLAALIGMLAATALYFAADIWQLMLGVWHTLRGRQRPQQRFLGLLILATLPAAILLVTDPTLLSPALPLEVTGWSTFAGGLLLLLSDRLAMTIRRIEHMRVYDALVFGFFQLLGLLPGASRTGATMVAGRILGLERGEAARFALLMSLPALAGTAGLVGYDLFSRDLLAFEPRALSVGGVAFVAAFLAIAALFRWLKRRTYVAFAIYRILLGLLLLALAF
jgi:undecaprenyl-diphosphatase